METENKWDGFVKLLRPAVRYDDGRRLEKYKLVYLAVALCWQLDEQKKIRIQSFDADTAQVACAAHQGLWDEPLQD